MKANTSNFESYLKIKNDNSNQNSLEKASIGYFILDFRTMSFTHKKTKESQMILSHLTDKDILSFEQTVSTNDKGICDYPLGFQILTEAKTFILYANSRIIYNRWMDSLKEFFRAKGQNVRNHTPDKTPDKGKNYYLNPNFKQVDKSPINTKTKLAGSNQNNYNYYSNNNNITTDKDKLIGFDEDLINVLNDIEDSDKKGKKDSFKKHTFNNNIGNENFNSFEKGLQNAASGERNNNMEDFVYNDVYTLNNGPQAVVLTELNQEWDKDFNEISMLASNKDKGKPTYKKSEQLKTEMSKIMATKNPNVSRLDVSGTNDNNNMKYKSSILLFDDPSLHIRQAVNEAYVVENLHYGIEDNLNKSIDYKPTGTNVRTMNRNLTKKGREVNEKSIDGVNPNVTKKIIENNDSSWTFAITVPVRNDGK